MATINGGSGDDSLEGTSGDDSITGFGGSDTLRGFGGNDTLVGGDGTRDILDGGAGDDLIDGGAGQDAIVIYENDGTDTIDGGGTSEDAVGDYLELWSNSSDGVSVTFSATDGSGSYSYLGSGTASGTFTNLEQVYTTNNDDLVDRSATTSGEQYVNTRDGDDTLLGGAARDIFDGGAGNDSLDGAGGDDQLFGSAGQDTISGGDGDDEIDGGAGDDSLTGGAGADTFTVSTGNDTITDFDPTGAGDGDFTNNDFIDLSAYYDSLNELRADQADDGILNQSNTTDDGGNPVDYSDNTQFSGSSLTVQGASASDFTADNTGVVCFTAGTMIATPEGERPVETLRIGDLVTTRNGGAEPIRWLGARTLGRAALAARPDLRPILLEPRWTGCGKRILLSRQHAVLVRSRHLPGDRLARAIQLARLKGGAVRVANGIRKVTYVHLMLPRHGVVFADGLATETFYPGARALEALDPKARLSLLVEFPGCDFPEIAASYGPPVVPYAKSRDLGTSLEALRPENGGTQSCRPTVPFYGIASQRSTVTIRGGV